ASSRPNVCRANSYSSSSPEPKKSGSSALRLTLTPAASNCGSGWDWKSLQTRSSTLEVGHTSSVISSRARRSSRRGSSAARTQVSLGAFGAVEHHFEDRLFTGQSQAVGLLDGDPL